MRLELSVGLYSSRCDTGVVTVPLELSVCPWSLCPWGSRYTPGKLACPCSLGATGVVSVPLELSVCPWSSHRASGAVNLFRELNHSMLHQVHNLWHACQILFQSTL